MRDPERLEVLERASELTALTYAATRTLPATERAGMRTQMERAAVSIGSNIAEGCGRSTDRAFLSYLQNAVASVSELAYQASLATRLGLGDADALRTVEEMAARVRRMLAKLTTAVRNRERERERRPPRQGDAKRRRPPRPPA